MNGTERQAHRYADVGWHVLPVEPGGKRPITKHGLLDATIDHKSIARWWRRTPYANVAVRTGAGFGPDALDVDRKPEGSGYPALRKLQAAGLMPESPVIRTPSGGAHLLYLGSQEGNHSLPRHCLDYRSAGGYIVAAPSQIGGRAYEVLKAVPVRHAFDWQAAKALLEPERQRERAQVEADPAEELGRLAGWLSRQREGNRNGALFYAANRALEHGHDDLDELAKAAEAIGLEAREIQATIGSARRTTGRGADCRPFGHDREAG